MKTKRVHSTSVVIEDAGVMITGKSGFGKSDLALRLIDSGATLISDDITICEKIGKSIFLFPPNETKGLLEVREIGIMTVPYIENIKLTLLVELVEKEIDRLPKQTFTKLMNTKIQKINSTGKFQVLTLMASILEIRIFFLDFLLKDLLMMQKNLEEFL